MGREGWEGEEREGRAEKVWRRWQRRSGVLTSRGRHNGEALAGPGGAGGGRARHGPFVPFGLCVCLLVCLCVCGLRVARLCVFSVLFDARCIGVTLELLHMFRLL